MRPPPTLRGPARAPLPRWLAALAWLAACSPERPRWVDLAALEPERVRLEPAPDAPIALATPAGAPMELFREGAETWAAVALPRSSWQPVEPAGAWLCAVPDGQPLATPRDARVATERLEDGARRFEAVLLDDEGRYRVATDAFWRSGSALQLRLEPGREPPEHLRFAWRATLGGRAGERWRVAGSTLSGDGFAVPPGGACALSVELPPDAALRFAACSEPALVPGASDGAAPVNVFRVRLDGELLLEHEQPLVEGGRTSWLEVPLPRAGAGELCLEVAGPFAYTSFLSPVVGPARVADRRATARAAARPNLVLFAADTLRADALAAYRDEPLPGGVELTPELDRLARESRVFTQARSVSTWTLPSFSSILTGYFPSQVSATQMDSALPEQALTLAEHLRAHGYRTLAVTEGGFLSRKHGFDQGFAWFREGDKEEGAEDVDETLTAALDALAADDGRPAFLFVHTFRAHGPYRVSEATRARLGAPLGLEDGDTWERWFSAAPDATVERKMRALYLGGVADLDRAFGTFRAALERAGALANGYLLFTSDHGEAFGEHGQHLHTGPPYEMLVRVPLILAGKDVAPALDTSAASLVDVTPTLCALSGVAPPEPFAGRSLLAIDDGRPVVAFQFAQPGSPSSIAVVQGKRKVMGLRLADLAAAGEVHAAYDLASDPHETRDVSQAAPWGRALLDEHAELLRGALEPRLPASEAVLDPLQRAELRALGYVDVKDAAAAAGAATPAAPAGRAPGG